MDPIFKKLNFKEQAPILVLNAPDSFRKNMRAMAGWTQFIENSDEVETLDFAMAFVTQQAEIDAIVPRLVPKLQGDALLWFCYPKGSSKNYTCDFNRDTGWAILGEHGWEGVRMVAIDKDWSALRFRRVEYIKKLTRRTSMALTKEGKARTTNRKKP